MTIESFINILLIITYVLMAVSLVAVIVFPLYHMFADFAKAKGALLGLLGVAVLFGISFMVSAKCWDVSPRKLPCACVANTSQSSHPMSTPATSLWWSTPLRFV